jgi:LPS export ABC transporter permease LptF/LPS export ABC transporter permease LptG
VRLPRPPIIDRYIVREMVTPTALGLLVFTFILLLQQITLLTGMLIARGADFSTILRLFGNLLPSILSTTIPMASLLGVLLAFGRMASDSEIIALRASGVSPGRLLRPVLVQSLVTGFATLYVISVALPEANQAYRELYYSLVVGKARTGVKPRVFADDLIPGMMLYVSDIPSETGQWTNVFIHDTRDTNEPKVILARTGRLVIEEHARSVYLHLEHGVTHSFDPTNPKDGYHQERFLKGDFDLSFDDLFPKVPLAKGGRELTLSELSARIRQLQAERKFKEIPRFAIEWHKKFAIATACLVFGLLGLGLSLGSRREARSAAFGLSIAVIFVYYVIIRLGEQAGDTGLLSPFLSMWGANIVLGVVAFVLLILNHRAAAFDPLDPSHYLRLLPRIRLRGGLQGRNVLPKGRPPGRPPIVVVRIPRLSLPLPGILDRYIAWQYIGHLTLVLSCFWSLSILSNFIDLFDDIEEHRVRGGIVFHYYAFWSPFVVHLVAPIAVLLATLVTFGILTKTNEITAMKAGGISIYRATVPTVVLGLLGSLCIFGLGDYLLPYTNRVAEADHNVIKGKPPQSSSYTNHRWVLAGDGRIYNYEWLVEGKHPSAAGLPEGSRTDETAFYGLWVYTLDLQSWSLKQALFARRATWDGSTYDLEKGWRREISGARAEFKGFDHSRTREVEVPSYFQKEQPESDTLGFADLRAHIDTLEKVGFDVTKLRVALYRKVAYPAACVVMTLIGIPFSFSVGKKGALYGIGISLAVGMLYWTCLSVFESLGNNALLPPLLAAWGANILFGAAGLYLMLTIET